MVRNPNRRKPVPKVLWTIYKDKAKSLAATITAIVPTKPSETSCRCHGRTCLQCCEDRMAFLLRENDPRDYKRLLLDSFVVVDEKSRFREYYPVRYWSQTQIVDRVIKMMREKNPNCCNVLYRSGRFARSSMVLKHLNSSPWKNLLERVGDFFMVDLLRHSSIFVPISRWKHLQLAGSPINVLCKELLKDDSKPESGYTKKRKRIDDSKSVSKRQQHVFFNSICLVGSGTVEDVTMSDKSSSGEVQICSNQAVAKRKKSVRMNHWKRKKKRRLQNIQECSDRASCGTQGSSLPKSVRCPSLTEQSPLQCACYSMLKAPLLLSNSDEIFRQPMFYNFDSSSSVLPQGHILNGLVPNFLNAKRLMENMFGLSDVTVPSQPMPCFQDSGSCVDASYCLYHSFLKLLKKLIRHSRRCNHLKLLAKYCSTPSYGQSSTKVERKALHKKVFKQSHCIDTKAHNKTLEVDNIQLETNRHYCLQSQVEAFAWAVCRSVVPSELLGTPSNQRILKRNISKFIQLRRFEKFSLKQCMHQLRRLNFPFLSNHCTSCCSNGMVPKNGEGQKKFNGESCNMHTVKHKLFVTWIFWLFSSLVVPLVQSNFYVTESEHIKNYVFYYPKSVWVKFQDYAITHLKEQSYAEVDEGVLKSIIQRRCFGFSKLRICPKQNGVRLLANHTATSIVQVKGSRSKHKHSFMHKISRPPYRQAKAKCFKPVNHVLRNAHTVFKGLSLKKPEKLGSSVFNYNEVHKKLRLFLKNLIYFSITMPEVYIVIADVSKAFDSIKQDKMVSIMEDFLAEYEYNMRQIHQVVSSRNCLWDHENLVLADETVSENVTSSVKFPSLPGIFVDQGCRQFLLRNDMLFDLKEHVKNNVVKLDKKYYLQGMGISQGSVMSSLLCSLYYGHMEEQKIYPYLEKTGISTQQLFREIVVKSPHYLLLRYTDDYLFISTSKDQASGFLSMLRQGFPDYNCFMNESKFCTNFDIENQAGNRVYVADDGTSFLRWSGLLINCKSLEIQGDYTRYLASHLKSTLTVFWQGRPGRNLKKKLRSFIQPKCCAIFFDLCINSPSVVRINIYQVFLLCAMKFHCYIREVSHIFKPSPRFCFKMIESSFRYLSKLIWKRMESVSPRLASYTVRKEEVIWLGRHAYISVLKRKQSRYKMLLSKLRLQFYTHKSRRIDESVVLKDAVKKSHSCCLWRIKY